MISATTRKERSDLELPAFVVSADIGVGVRENFLGLLSIGQIITNYHEPS